MSGRNRGGGRGQGQQGQRGGGQGQQGQRRGGPPRGGGSQQRGGGGGQGGGQGGGNIMQLASRPAAPVGAIYLADVPIPDGDPDPDIRKLEDALVLQTKGRFTDGFPGRTGYGTQGDKIKLRTNYFKVAAAPDADTLYRYKIKITPDQSKPKRRLFIEELLKNPRFNGVHWATDYSEILVTTKEIDLKGKKPWEEKILLPSPNDNSQQSQPGAPPQFVQQARQRNTATVKVTYESSYALSDLISHLQSTSGGAGYVGVEPFIQMLNIIVAKAPYTATNVANVGGNKFYPFHGHQLMQMAELGAGLQALRGYFSSVRPAIGRLLININVSSGAFYRPMPLIEMMRTMQGGPAEREAFIHHLKVEAVYKKDNQTQPFMRKKKTIVGFAKEPENSPIQIKRFGNAKEVRFRYRASQNAPEQEITVFDYFKNHHNITLQRPELPVLNVGTRQDPQYLPTELCTVLPGQPYRKLLGGDQTAEMITFAARPPNANAMSIAGTRNNPGNGLKLFALAAPPGQNNPQANSVQPFGMTMATEMLTVPGRVLRAPTIQYRGTQTARVQNASWNLMNLRFRQPGRFEHWQFVAIAEKRKDGSIRSPLIENPTGDMLGPQGLIDLFKTSMADYGIALGKQEDTVKLALAPLTRENRAQNNATISSMFQKHKEKGKQLMLIILPAQDRWLYSRIKYYGDVEYGIHTVNAIGNKIQKPGRGQPMYIGNLALKVNVKGGGVSHDVPNTLMGPVGNDTILFGIDVTHPSPGSADGAPSIASVVANTNATLFHWPGSIRTQKGKQEMVDSLEEMVLERLDCWSKHNKGKRPDRVVIYRDGVSEGQFKTVLTDELPSFEKAYAKRYGDQAKWPKTAIIIVGKRHHTRFYPTTKEEADQYTDTRTNQQKGSWNPKPGTVVDRGIVGRVIREFYLQAHQGLQGTAKPAHYSVIKDEVGFSADQLERFTLNLCYYFSRCTKAVSVCPPAYYADLLAERGRAYLYAILQENHGDDASSVHSNDTPWTKDVHEDIAQDTWYI